MIKKIINWLNAPANVYVACKMTGLPQNELLEKAYKISEALAKHGLTVHHPVLKEGIKKVTTKLQDRTFEEMVKIWNDDKRAVHRASVIFDTAAEVYSTGAKREVGKARYGDWTILVSLWEHLEPPFIAKDEDDACVKSADEAGQIISKLWGTRLKRMAWRFPIYLNNWYDISLRKIYQFFK